MNNQLPTTAIVTVAGMIGPQDWSELAEVSEVRYIERSKVSQSELVSLCEGIDYLMLNYDVVRTLDGTFYADERVKRLKGVSVDITGMDWANPHLARKHNIALSYTPFYSTESVAEAIVGEVLLHAKERHNAYVDELRGAVPLERQGIDLLGKVAGVIGYGHIGARVADLLSGIGMSVRIWNRSPKQTNYPLYELRELFSSCDVLCVCLKTVLSGADSNNQIIDKLLLSKLQRGAILVNLASHHLVDNDEVLRLIKDGTVRGYSVTSNDETKALGMSTDYGFSFPPANAWFSEESLEKLRTIWIQNVISMIEGMPQNLYVD